MPDNHDAADPDHEGHDHEPQGFAIRLPLNLTEAMREQTREEHALMHARQANAMNELFELYQRTPPKDLVKWRRMFMNDESKQANFFDGLIVGALVLHHKVDPDSGLTAEEALLEGKRPKLPCEE